MQSISEGGMGSPVYMLLLLVNEKNCFDQWLRRRGQSGDSKQIGRRVGRVTM